MRANDIKHLSLMKNTIETTHVVLSWCRFPHPLTPASSPPNGLVIMVIPVVPMGLVVEGRTLTSSTHRSRKYLLVQLGRQSHRVKAGSALHQVSALHLLLGALWHHLDPNTGPRSLDSSCQGLPEPALENPESSSHTGNTDGAATLQISLQAPQLVERGVTT